MASTSHKASFPPSATQDLDMEPDFSMNLSPSDFLNPLPTGATTSPPRPRSGTMHTPPSSDPFLSCTMSPLQSPPPVSLCRGARKVPEILPNRASPVTSAPPGVPVASTQPTSSATCGSGLTGAQVHHILMEQSAVDNRALATTREQFLVRQSARCVVAYLLSGAFEGSDGLPAFNEAARAWLLRFL